MLVRMSLVLHEFSHIPSIGHINNNVDLMNAGKVRGPQKLLQLILRGDMDV